MENEEKETMHPNSSDSHHEEGANVINEDDINKDTTDDHTSEEIEVADSEQTQDADKTEEAYQALIEEKDALEDKVLRLQAEISNIQRRNTIDRQSAAKYRSQSLATELLDVLDNLERALTTDIQSEDGKNLKQGIEMVHKQFLAAFEKEKIAVIDPESEAFDPNVHQAVSMMPGGEGVESNTVINVLQKGYLLEDRVLRPAMVIVAE